MKYNGKLDIATGKSRHTKQWKNEEILWSALLEKLKATKRTDETCREYKTAGKARQDEIKDVGGFVGGYLNGGSRKARNLLHRQLVTLDMDFGSVEVYEKLKQEFNCASCVYSTHSHSPNTPRLRIVMPLSRPVFSEEYQAISRKIAGGLDIEVFDDTTYEPSRLMYWPSTSKDGEFIFDSLDAPWLDADEILGSYLDWEDTSAWPMSNRVQEDLQHRAKTQEDPLGKTGLIGAFCRAYTIEEAIETFLPDVYELSELGGRYTYKDGSTTGGLVIYEEMFAYSHHGTDPVSGKLCNAFDLVRLHKFGLRDEEAKPKTPMNKLPSYTAMHEFVTTLDPVKKLINLEKRAEIETDFAVTEEEDFDWLAKLDVDTKGRNKPTVSNIRLIMENDPALIDRFALNAFEHRPVIKGDLPWRKVDPRDPYHKDVDDAGIREYIEELYGITGPQKVNDAYSLVAMDNAYHPVKEYLLAHTWDKKERIDTLLIDYHGAENTDYNKLTIRKALIACVARIFEPGIKFDHILTLVGPQGTGKSTFFRKLGKNWFSDTFTTVKGKEAYEQLQGIWIIEIGELAAFKEWEIEHVKQFISKQTDFYRVAYGKRNESFPRQCVFFGTTNRSDFLKDPTGNRRFWPVDIRRKEPQKCIFKDLTPYEVDQIWAEAVICYLSGETLYLPKELEKMAIEAQSAHSEFDSLKGLVEVYLSMEIPENWYQLSVVQMRNYAEGEDRIDIIYSENMVKRDRVCTLEIWCVALGKERGDFTRREDRRIRDILISLENWEEYDKSINRGRMRFGKILGLQKAFVPTYEVYPTSGVQ